MRADKVPDSQCGAKPYWSNCLPTKYLRSMPPNTHSTNDWPCNGIELLLLMLSRQVSCLQFCLDGKLHLNGKDTPDQDLTNQAAGMTVEHSRKSAGGFVRLHPLGEVHVGEIT